MTAISKGSIDNLMKLSVLMPVYNEARTLREIVRRVMRAPIDWDIELVAVDDSSTDRSWEILQSLAAENPHIIALRHQANRGKGAAIRTAIQAMTGDVAVVQDSDLEYDPAEYPNLLRPIVDGRADAVFGSRFAASPERRVLLYWHSLGNRFLTLLTNVLNNINLTDMETGYKAVRADILRELRLRSERFGIEPELTTRLAQWGARIYEVPISYHGRSYAEGKNIGWRDGVQAIFLLFKYRFLDTKFSDRMGHQTLESIGRAPRLVAWTLDQFRPFLRGSLLEAGSGTGNFTMRLLRADRLVAVDVDEFYCDALRRRFGHLENVEILQGDLEDQTLYLKLGHGAFDSVLCVNVLEHLGRPDLALRGFADSLAEGGHALILVPAHQWLFSATDEAIGHHTRYEAKSLAHLLTGAGLTIVEMRQFNRLGVAGWFINKLLKKTSVSRWQMRLFAIMLPIARLVEQARILPGLSFVAIARKP